MLGPIQQGGEPEAQSFCQSYELGWRSYLVAHPQHLHLGVLAINLFAF